MIGIQETSKVLSNLISSQSLSTDALSALDIHEAWKYVSDEVRDAVCSAVTNYSQLCGYATWFGFAVDEDFLVLLLKFSYRYWG